MSYLTPNRGTTTIVGTPNTTASYGAGGTVISGSPRTSTYVTPMTSSPRGSTYIPGITSSPRSSTYVTGGTNFTQAATNVISSSPRSSTYIPQTTSTYIPSGTTYTGAPTTTTYNGGTTTYTGAPTTTYLGASPRSSGYVQGGVTYTTSPTTTPGKISGYVPSTTLPSRGSTYISGTPSTIKSPTITTQYGSQQPRVVSHNEYTLQQRCEMLERENKQLKDDKDRMTVIIHDLKKYAPDYKGAEPDDPDLDGSYLNLKHRNVVETLEVQNKQLKKKNKMLMDENEMLKTQVRSLCAADDSLNDKFLQTEVGKLQSKIRELKAKNNEMEIQIRTYESDKKLGVPKNKYDIVNFDDGLREDHERLKRDLTAAYKRIGELESGENALGKTNIDKYRALTNRVNDLERQNSQLLNRIRDNNDIQTVKRSGMDSEKDAEIFRLQRENEDLKSELMEKNETIRRLQASKGGSEENSEAVQRLIAANERLLAQVMQYQDKMNQSVSRMDNSMMSKLGESKAKFGGGGGGGGVLRSEFMDPYKDSRYMD
jgi:hypothetical protein